MCKNLVSRFLILVLLKTFFVDGVNSANPPKSFGGAGPFTFDYLLGENKNFTTSANVIFLDYDLKEQIIRDLLAKGKRVICYVNVGAWENWRSDAGDFPPEVIGKNYSGWDGENWLDIRKQDILLPIMRKRFRAAALKGCEGIDPDNMNGYEEDTGFPLKADDQISYNKAIAREIRANAMLAGLKNDNDQAKQLVNETDFAVVESCAYYEECDNFEAYVKTNKPVFAIEYTNKWTQRAFKNDVCPYGKKTGISFILKKRDLLNNFIVSCISSTAPPRRGTGRNSTK